MRSGSARRSISTIFPLRTVNPPTENSASSRHATNPAAPLTSAGRDVQPRGESAGFLRDRLSAADLLHGNQRAGVDLEDDLGVEHAQQRLEVAFVGRGEEGDDVRLSGDVRVGLRSAAHLPARPASELPRGLGRAVHDWGDLGERYAEHVVQHERQALGGIELVEHHKRPHRPGPRARAGFVDRGR